METAGVIVLAWENATTNDSVITSAYRAAADMINNYIDDLVTKALDDILGGKPADELDVEPSAADIACLEEDIRTTVSDTIRRGSGLFQAIPDHDIGSAYFLTNISEPVQECLTFTFTKKSTHYVLEGDLTYDLPASKPGRVPTGPPPKHQEPKPQARR